MSRGTILVIDDEPDLTELLRYNLELERFTVLTASDGRSGLHTAVALQPDAVVLDLMMPGMDGLEVCRQLRRDSRTSRIPILMLTARVTEADRVVGLEMGADDYIVKPFSPRELVARLKAVLRRCAPPEVPELLIRGRLVVDVARHEVTCDGELVSLTATEFRILRFLAGRPGRVFTREEIIDGALPHDDIVLDRTVDVHIVGIRKKLGRGGAMIETVRGFGYRLNDRTETSAD